MKVTRACPEAVFQTLEHGQHHYSTKSKAGEEMIDSHKIPFWRVNFIEERLRMNEIAARSPPI